MSGGEKALTSVALIFSIFLVKPSPYCLLDEVDAPLDDANVFRFNDLVKEMAKRSQIIVVTHNKHTMEINDKLYGVAFTVYDEWAWLKVTRECEGLDEKEAGSLIGKIGQYAAQLGKCGEDSGASASGEWLPAVQDG